MEGRVCVCVPLRWVEGNRVRFSFDPVGNRQTREVHAVLRLPSDLACVHRRGHRVVIGAEEEEERKETIPSIYARRATRSAATIDTAKSSATVLRSDNNNIITHTPCKQKGR